MSDRAWRTTFLDMTALLFVFLVLLAAAPPPSIAPVAGAAASSTDRPMPDHGQGLLMALLQDAADAGRLDGAEITARFATVIVGMPLLLPISPADLVEQVDRVGEIVRHLDVAGLEVTIEVPPLAVEEAVAAIQETARQRARRWLVRSSDEPRAHLRIALEVGGG